MERNENITPYMRDIVNSISSVSLRLFRVHASQCHHIMGRIGLTESQYAKLAELSERYANPLAKALTDNMRKELTALRFSHANPDLPEGAKTFLAEWYANDREEISSKYLDKGNQVEQDNIDFAARVLGYGLAEKNKVYASDEWMIGCCDVNWPDAILDVKSPYNRTTFHQNIYGITPDHEWQGRVYMRLYNRLKFILFFGLQNTPATDWNEEIIFDDRPEQERWIAYEIKRDQAKELEIIKRVKMCRKWLGEYDAMVKKMVGRVTVL